MEIHLFAASYTAPLGKHNIPDNHLKWSKIAVFNEQTDAKSGSKVRVVIEALKSRLAHEVRKLASSRTK